MDDKIDMIIKSLKSIKTEKDERKKRNMLGWILYLFKQYFNL